MDDHGRIDQALALLAKAGAYEVLQAMYSRDGAATFAEIAGEARGALALLRALAAEGFVFSYRCGSLDVEPSATTVFLLTARGDAVAGHLTRLRQWAVSRSGRRSTPRATG